MLRSFLQRLFVRRPPVRGGLAPVAVAFIALTAAILLPTLTAEADVIYLKSGAVVHGTVLKRNDQKLWVDLGPDVLSINLDDVDRVEAAEAGAKMQVQPESIFRVAVNLAELSPREQAKRIGPAVIKVSTPSGLGSGVIINEEGLAVTNAHVIQGEAVLRVTVWFPEADGTLQRTEIEDIEILAVNNHLDLALLRITHPDGLPFDFAPLEKQELIEVGQVVFAIGNPLGLERSLSQGVVSTTQRSFDGLTYVQTDAAINPGNSGGPLFNTKGEVIGITNMGIRGGEALGFAIPARYVKDFLRNREAFTYDKNNPNSGYRYHQPPPRLRGGIAPALQDGSSGGPAG